MPEQNLLECLFSLLGFLIGFMLNSELIILTFDQSQGKLKSEFYFQFSPLLLPSRLLMPSILLMGSMDSQEDSW